MKLTQEELYTTLAELIIMQEKPKSTGNSHKRKQWENRRNWRLCTMGMSCKMGYVKICPIANMKPFKRKVAKSLICRDCCVNLRSPWGIIMGGVIYWCDHDTHYKRVSYNCKGLRVELNRRLRRTCKGEIGNYGYYRKMFEYQWECV